MEKKFVDFVEGAISKCASKMADHEVIIHGGTTADYIDKTADCARWRAKANSKAELIEVCGKMAGWYPNRDVRFIFPSTTITSTGECLGKSSKTTGVGRENISLIKEAIDEQGWSFGISVCGKTYPYREELKDFGFKFDYDFKEWDKEIGDWEFLDKILDFVHGTGMNVQVWAKGEPVVIDLRKEIPKKYDFTKEGREKTKKRSGRGR